MLGLIDVDKTEYFFMPIMKLHKVDQCNGKHLRKLEMIHYKWDTIKEKILEKSNIKKLIS